MKPYKSLFKIRFINTLQYRTAAFAGVLTQFAFGLLYVLLFRAFYAQGNIPENFTLQQMTSYLWLQQMFFVLFFMVDKNPIMISQIEQGNICYELVRPMNLYGNWFCTLYAERVSKTLLRLIPVLILSILLPSGFGMGAPASILNFLLFLVNLIIGSLLIISINVIAYCLMFHTMSSIGIFSIISTLGALFNGSLIPLPLTPTWFQNLVNFLPFRYVNDLTFQTYVGSIPITDSLIQTVIQIAWLIFFVLIGNIWLKHNLKKVEVQGG